MRKRLPGYFGLIIVFLLLFIVIISRQENSDLQPVFTKVPSNELEEQDDMARAWHHEFLMTRDPALNKVPTERILDAKLKMDELLVASRNNSTSSLSWTERGPSNIGGRTRGIVVDRSDATGNTVFAAGVGGGLWKTVNFKSGSPTWTVVNDLFGNIAITCIKQSPVSSSVMYFGTGEGWGNYDAIEGLGIWKSTNSGATWIQLPATTGISYVEDLEFDNNGYIYASTRSTTAGLRGILRSADGGDNWVQVLTDPVEPISRGADLELAGDGDLYATIGIFTTGHVFRSATNGVNTGISGSWTEITPDDITTNAYQRVELAVCPGQPDRVYAIAQNDATDGVGAMYRSDNDGGAWTTLTNASWCDQGASTNADFSRGQAWYDLIMAVDPNNSSLLMAGGVVIVKSTNAGTSWSQATRWISSASCTTAPVIHADIHEILFMNSSELIIGTDGGIYYSSDGGASFVSKNTGFNVTQYYGMAISPTSGSNTMIGGTQDNGSHLFTSPGMNAVTSITGGDGGFSFIDTTNSTAWVTSNPGGFFNVYRNSGSTYVGTGGSGNGRFVAAADYASVINTLYYCDGDGLYGRIFNVESGSASFGTVNVSSEMGANRQVSCIKIDQADETTIWLGCSDSETNGGAPVTPILLKVIRADGPTGGNPAFRPEATAFAGPPLPAGTYISSIDIEKGNSNHMLLTASDYGVTSVWESTDGGNNWTAVEGNLPDMPVRWGMFIPNGWLARSNAVGGVMLATELGVWTTAALNGVSTSWVPNNSGLANVRTDMLVLRQSDKTVAAATHGRGIYTTTLLTTPLAVSLVEFTGKLQNNKAELRWTTASEYNSRQFELERSFDGINFRKITTVPAAGMSTTTLVYTYTDREPLTELNYYRLRSIDNDNESKLSNTILLKWMGAQQDILVLGNTFKQSLVVRFVRLPASGGELKLIDMGGRLITRQSFRAGEQQVQFTVPAGTTARGAYLLVAVIDGKSYTARVLKE